MADLVSATAPGQAGHSGNREFPSRKGSTATVSVTNVAYNSDDEPISPVSPTESTRLDPPNHSGHSYGTLPNRRRINTKLSATRRTFSQLPILNTLHRVRSGSLTTGIPYSAGFRDLSFSRLSTRPISSYDEPLQNTDDEITDADAKVNGIRVWYSSYTSIDWLHDAIKDSLRFAKLRRKRKSWRSRLRLVFDKSLGWIIVTIVGFITAIVAFFVVRSEQFLFDFKEGYCSSSWYKAKRFCCPNQSDLLNRFHFEELCSAWKPWSEVLDPHNGKNDSNAVEYVSYTIIAVSDLTCLLK